MKGTSLSGKEKVITRIKKIHERKMSHWYQQIYNKCSKSNTYKVNIKIKQQKQ